MSHGCWPEGMSVTALFVTQFCPKYLYRTLTCHRGMMLNQLVSYT